MILLCSSLVTAEFQLCNILCIDNTKWRSSSKEKALHTTSVDVIAHHVTARPVTSPTLAPSTNTARDEPSNKIPHFPGGSFFVVFLLQSMHSRGSVDVLSACMP